MGNWIYKNIFLRLVRPTLRRAGFDLVAFSRPTDKRDVFKRVESILSKIASYVPEKNPTPGERVIWQFWWQGPENAPPLVKRCMESVRQHAKGWKVIVVDERNVSQYADIPACIAGKHQRGLISHTHFSDYIRVKLLQEHGGVWIDSTVLLTDDIPDDILTARAFAFKTSLWASSDNIPMPDMFLTTIQTAGHGRIGGGECACSSWFLSSWRDSALMAIVTRALEWYWADAKRLDDYFLFHFLLSYAVSANKFCREEFTAMPTQINVKPHMLLFKLLDPFDLGEWRLLREISAIHKLSYKGNDLCSTEGTFLGALLSGDLTEE